MAGIRPPRLIRLTAESPDLLHLDALRFGAALAIVVVHFRTNLLAAWPGAQTAFSRLDGLAVSVDLFFAISGFVISWVYGDRLSSLAAYGTFLRKRVARLMPLHWATLGFFVLVGLVLQSQGGDAAPTKYNFSCLLTNAVLLQGWGLCGGPSFNTVSWSISAEMTMYFAYPLLFLAGARFPRIALIAVAALILALELGALAPPFWVERTHNLGVLRAFPGFCIGILLFQNRARMAQLPAPQAWLGAALAALIIGVGLGAPKSVLVLIAYAITACGIAADLQRKAGPMIARIAPAGRLTYSIYMLHPIAQSLFINIVGRRILGLEGAELTLWTLAALPVTIAISYLSLCLFEEPARRLLSGGHGPRRPTADPKDERFSI
ncbi:acyltransferase family protein [Altererythrobacter xixiisoli]|uniref:Acyltransferase family protein n=1 Tax=Croceibacterium xixiisoli TaxID=1476466 RepID=A0A6I4TVI1_9SPHN|nr:acyltransferase [Croceibacterium xixiisoli]MXO99219.1 acyltransferase family protein [Croceibacterium xixiisoli]